MIEYQSENITIAKLFTQSDFESTGLVFFSEPNDPIQVGLWNHSIDTVLPAHAHNIYDRKTDRTAEAIYVLSGKIHSDIYDESKNLIAQLELCKGDLLICLAGGHGYRVLEKNTRVLEFKNGPYAGADKDRTRFETACDLCK